MSKITYADKVALRELPIDDENKITADDVNEIKAAVNALYDKHGWASYADGQYTSGSPQAITEGNTAAIGNNAATSVTTYKPTNVSTLYSSGKIRPAAVGDAYIVDVHFTVACSANDGAFDIIIDNGHEIRRTVGMRRQAATQVHISQTFLLLGDADGVADGVGVSVEALNGNLTIWGAEYVISRIYAAG